MTKQLPDSTQASPESVDAGLTFRHAYHTVHLTESPTRAVVWTVISEYLAPLIAPTAHVLEIGAGYCYWINSVRAARRVAIDLWEELPEHAAPGVEPVRHDLSEGLAELGDQTFDVILASNVLEHFELAVVARLVRDVFQRLNPGGRLIVIQPNYFHAYRHYFDDYTHRSIFSHVSLPALLREHGFLIERMEPRFMPYSLRGSRWPIRPWLIRWYLRLPFRPWAGQMLIVAQKPIAQTGSRAR